MERNFKGIWIPKEIWLSKNLSMQEKILLVEIDSLDNKGGCFASNQYFADFMNLSTRRISDLIKKLVDKKLISSELHYKKGGKEIEKRILSTLWKKTSIGIEENFYTPMEENFLDNNIINNNIINNNKEYSTCNILKEKEKEKKEKEKKETIKDRDEVFNNLWRWYPGEKKAKLPAKLYFEKHIKTNYDLELLRYALPKYIASVKDKQYLVLLRTYLGNKLYLDYEDEYKSIILEIKKEPTLEINEELGKHMKYDSNGNYIG